VPCSIVSAMSDSAVIILSRTGCLVPALGQCVTLRVFGRGMRNLMYHPRVERTSAPDGRGHSTKAAQ
jgi:hypothetical protein